MNKDCSSIWCKEGVVVRFVHRAKWAPSVRYAERSAGMSDTKNLGAVPGSVSMASLGRSVIAHRSTGGGREDGKHDEKKEEGGNEEGPHRDSVYKEGCLCTPQGRA